MFKRLIKDEGSHSSWKAKRINEKEVITYKLFKCLQHQELLQSYKYKTLNSLEWLWKALLLLRDHEGRGAGRAVCLVLPVLLLGSFSRLQMARKRKINGETSTLTFVCIGQIFLSLPLWNGLCGPCCYGKLLSHKDDRNLFDIMPTVRHSSDTVISTCLCIVCYYFVTGMYTSLFPLAFPPFSSVTKELWPRDFRLQRNKLSWVWENYQKDA